MSRSWQWPSTVSTKRNEGSAANTETGGSGRFMCPVQGEGTKCQGLLCGLLPTELPLPVPSSSPRTGTGSQPVTPIRWWATWGAVAFSALYSQCWVPSEHLINAHCVYWSKGALCSEWGAAQASPGPGGNDPRLSLILWSPRSLLTANFSSKFSIPRVEIHWVNDVRALVLRCWFMP